MLLAQTIFIAFCWPWWCARDNPTYLSPHSFVAMSNRPVYLEMGSPLRVTDSRLTSKRLATATPVSDHGASNNEAFQARSAGYRAGKLVEQSHHGERSRSYDSESLLGKSRVWVSANTGCFCFYF
jgi:hypothetical protein